MMSQPGKQIHILPNISRSKGNILPNISRTKSNQTMKFGQLRLKLR